MLRKKEIVKAIHSGVFHAHKQFEWLSGGAWMADRGLPGIEGFAVSHIFRSIGTLMSDGETPILELPFNYIKWWTEADARGRPPKGSTPGRRVDIAIFNTKGRPIHIVEVKLKWAKDTGPADIEKLKLLMSSFGPRRNGTLKSAFLSVYWRGTNRPSLDKKMRDVEKEVKHNEDSSVKLDFSRRVWGPEEREGKDWKYGSQVIVLSRRYRRGK